MLGLAWLSQEQRAWLACALVSLEASAWLHLLLAGDPALPRVRTRRWEGGGERTRSALRAMARQDPLEEAMVELAAVVRQLRVPDQGCFWDLQQTHASLLPHALEEAHALADAIRHGDDHHLNEELVICCFRSCCTV